MYALTIRYRVEVLDMLIYAPLSTLGLCILVCGKFLKDVISNRVLHFLPRKHYAGLVPIPSDGVLLLANDVNSCNAIEMSGVCSNLGPRSVSDFMVKKWFPTL